jgi:hypothetical protein
MVLSAKRTIVSRPAQRILFFLLVEFLLFGPAPAKSLDLGTISDPSGEYDIAFCARPSPDSTGKPGHAFVAFSHKSAQGDRDFFAVGHTVGTGTTVASATWSYWGSPIQGRLKEERFTALRQICLTIRVNQPDYDSGVAQTVNPLAKLGLARSGDIIFESYKLGAEDCINFVISVANVLRSKGLKIPDRGATELPMDYMRRFIAAN